MKKTYIYNIYNKRTKQLSAKQSKRIFENLDKNHRDIIFN